MLSLTAGQWVQAADVWVAVCVGLVGGLTGGVGVRLSRVYTAMLAQGCNPTTVVFRHALMIAVSTNGSAHRVVGCRMAWLASVFMAGATAALCLRYGVSLYFFALSVATLALLVLALIDARCGLLPDALTLPLLWIGLSMAWLGHGPTLHQAVSGVFLGYLFPWALFFVYKCARHVDGMGQGDFKLLAALGAWLGWQALAPVLLLASLAAVAAAMWHQKSFWPGGVYPFGPFLIVSAMGFFVGGSALHSWFL